MKHFFVTFLCLTAYFISVSAQEYTDVSELLGVKHTFGSDAYAGGISFCDFDQDGWDDLTFATQQGDSVVFYQNTGSVFQEVYFEGIHHDGHVKQILWCDYDNDGDKDLYISGRSSPNYIYINNGNFVFSPYLLPAPSPFNTGDTYGANFADIDLDGDVDLFICNRIESIPLPNQLFLNNGDGTMTDVTEAFFFDTLYQLTFCAAFIDYNNDGLPDLYTAEDRFGINQLYANIGNGLFIDDCNGCGAEIEIDAMSVCPGDYDNDGDLDIYISNTQDGNVLLKNNGNGTFTDATAIAGVAYNQVAWGATFFDYDHDKDLDLYVSGSTNGQTMRNVLYQNQNDGTFSETGNNGFEGDSTRSFSHAVGDINNDGYFDIAVLNILPDSSQVWQSTGGVNNWIKIELTGIISNRDGIGSWIEVWSDGQKQAQYTTCGSGYLAQNSNARIFGLASATIADSIIIKWPSGIVDRKFAVPANQRLSITEGSPTTGFEDTPSAISEIVVSPNPFEHLIHIDVPFLNNSGLCFELYDEIGKCVFFGEMDHQSNSIILSTDMLVPGVYHLKIIANGIDRTIRLVKI